MKKNDVVWLDQNERGLLKLSGESRTDLIHRMSTQDLRGMQSGEGRATVLTTEIGRIIDRVILFDRGDDVYMLTSDNNADGIARYLLRFVFFNDDFQIEPVQDVGIIGVYGEGAAALLDVSLPLYGWEAHTYRIDPIAGDGYLLIFPAADREQVVAQLTEKGAAEIDAAAYERLRIASGQPRFGHELTSEYIPLETGLWDDVSFTKGCYIGQEIIARMESRGKLAKRLVSLAAAGTIAAGDEVTADGKTVGKITSAADQIALAYIKTAALDNDRPLTTASGTALHVRKQS